MSIGVGGIVGLVFAGLFIVGVGVLMCCGGPGSSPRPKRHKSKSESSSKQDVSIDVPSIV